MKAALYFVAFLLVLLLAAAIAAPYFLDINRHKPRLAGIIEEKTGYGIKLNGEAKAVFFPSFSLDLADVEIYASPDYADKIAATKNVSLNMNLFNAIGGKVTVDALTLDSPQLWIKKNKDGLHNYEKPAAKKDEKDGDSPQFLGINRLKIINAKGQYSADGKTYAMEGVQLDAGYRPAENNNRFDLAVASLSGGGVSEKDLRLAAKYGYKNDRLQLSDIAARLRGHEFTGDGAVSVGKKITSGTLNLRGKDVDLVKLLGIKPATTPKAPAKKNAPAAPAGWSDAPLGLTSVKNMDLAISFAADSVRYFDADIRPFSASIALKPDGAVSLLSEKARFAKGEISLRADAKPLNANASAVNLAVGVKDLSTADLPAVLIAKGAPASGVANFSADLSMRGVSEKDMIASMGGKASVKVTDGKIRSNRLFDAFYKGKAALEGKPAEPQADYIVLSQFSANFLGKAGMFTTEDMQAKTDKLDIAGKGDLDIYNKRIDMTFTAQPQASADARQALSAVPVRVVGDFSQPKILLDLNAGIKRILENPENFKDAVQGLREGFSEDIKGVKNQLDRIFDKKKPQAKDGANDNAESGGGFGTFLKQLGQ